MGSVRFSLNRSSALRTFVKSLATFAFRELFNAKQCKAVSQRYAKSKLLPHYHRWRGLTDSVFGMLDCWPMNTADFTIRRARPDEAGTLTEIAHAAKRHWGYPENWIEHWKDDLTITPDFIAKHEVYVAMIGDDIAGCCALVIDDAQAELEHMWVKPEHIGIGVGKALFTHVAGRARDLDLGVLEISADPNAEGFYQRLGATRIGDVRSEMEGQPRVLPRM